MNLFKILTFFNDYDINNIVSNIIIMAFIKNIFQEFYPGDKFSYNGYTGTVIRLADIDEGGADFYFAEINYVVEMDDPIVSTTYNIYGIKIMTQDKMIKL